MYPKYKKRAVRKVTLRRKVKPSKALKLAIKQVVKRNIETKIINVPTAGSTTVNTNNLVYPALSGIQYLAFDVFSCPQGVNDSSLILSPNRVGDQIEAVGFEMDYYFSLASSFTLGANVYHIPYVKLRIVAFKQAFGVPNLGTALVFDTNYNTANTSTLQPINWDEGYVKGVLFDKTYVIKGSDFSIAPLPNTTLPVTQCMHFKKYIKYPHRVKFCDNNTASPNATTMPIQIAIIAEVDDSFTGAVPSGARIMYTTGHTRAWFKDG